MLQPHLRPGDIRPWMMETLLPFWADVGVDRECGGFVERLSLDRRPAPDDYKRVRAQARQIYVFSHAHLLGAPEWALDAVHHGVAFLTERCWDRIHGGWYHQVTRTGAPLDVRKDTYDHAFVLFAMAWLHRATGNPAALDWARRTIAFLDDRLGDPTGGGYWEAVSPDGATDRLPRRQNPHMHLLEAFIALHEATGDADWLDRARAMVGLFQDRFFDADTGSLREYFTADWRPAPGADGRIREPGHHFEWFWLLHHYRRLTGDDSVLDPAEALLFFAMKHGIDELTEGVPVAFDAVGADGTVLAGTKRLWPQTEAVKAHLARYEFAHGAPPEPDPLSARLHLLTMFGEYIDLDHGVWHDQLARDGTPVTEYIPSSTLYHLVLCLAEASRLLRD
ncbi:MAG: AGE family epimerase/isomerase [Alphaproteobacteria bacterium]